jgi:hypothetical protein
MSLATCLTWILTCLPVDLLTTYLSWCHLPPLLCPTAPVHLAHTCCGVILAPDLSPGKQRSRDRYHGHLPPFRPGAKATAQSGHHSSTSTTQSHQPHSHPSPSGNSRFGTLVISVYGFFVCPQQDPPGRISPCREGAGLLASWMNE